jgi:hypothetical protein
MRPILVLLGALAVLTAAPTGFIDKRGNKLFLNGKEYRAIGVNMPNLHSSYNGTFFHNLEKYGTHEKARQAMIDGVVDAAKSGAAFIRFFAGPGYPKDISLLYAKDPATYWRLMDEVFALCRTNGLRLVPSLGTITGWHLSCGEYKQAILDPSSRTYAATIRYVREFVTRYKNDPTVLLWELENEVMLKADVDEKGRKLKPAIVYPENHPYPIRTNGAREDSLTWDMIQRIYREHSAFIKSIDANHLVTSGDSKTRDECSSRRETFPDFKYRNDTWNEHLSNNIASQASLDVFSFHQYGKPGDLSDPKKYPGWPATSKERANRLVGAALASGKPVFIGELGQDTPKHVEDPGLGWTLDYIDQCEKEGVPLICFWVWHFTWQEKSFNVTSATHPALAKRMGAWNGKYAK